MSIIKTERSFIYTPTRCYVILTTLFAFRTQQLFFFSIVSVYARKKNEKDFCSAQRSCLYASDLCVYKYIYIYMEEKKVLALGWEATTIMWQYYVKKKKSLVLMDTKIGCMMWWFLLRTYCALLTKHHTYIYIYIYIHIRAK